MSCINRSDYLLSHLGTSKLLNVSVWGNVVLALTSPINLQPLSLRSSCSLDGHPVTAVSTYCSIKLALIHSLFFSMGVCADIKLILLNHPPTVKVHGL